jgi:WD40 repeat protein
VFARDGERLFSFGFDGAMAWDLGTGRARGWVTREKTDGFEAAPDGETLYVASTSGLERRRAAAPFEPGDVLLRGDQDQCDLSADGRLLAVRDDLELQLVDPARPDDVRRIAGYPGFEYVAVSARGTYVAGMTWQGPGMTLWRAADGAVLARLREDRAALGAAISPDETRLVVSDGVAYEIYALPDVALVHVVERDVAMRESSGMLAFSEDGALLALGLTVETVGLFDGHSYAPVARLEARGASFDGRMAFSFDGTRLAIASGTNRVYVWDLAKLRTALAAAGIAWESD